MQKSAERDPKRRNRLLGALEPDIQERVFPYLETVTLELEHVVCEAGNLLRHAYFPEGGVLSLLTVLENGSTVETASIGREGAYGLLAAMYGRSSFNRCIVQLTGPIARCPIDVLHHQFQHSERVRDLFVGYSETLLSQAQQTGACNALHRMEERMSRWLLMMADRAEGQPLAYTHEFLAHILGANRKSVTLAAQALQASALIEYHRGQIEIKDRAGLERASCECYRAVGAIHSRMPEMRRSSAAKS